jgi:hypothetical protein
LSLYQRHQFLGYSPNPDKKCLITWFLYSDMWNPSADP